MRSTYGGRFQRYISLAALTLATAAVLGTSFAQTQSPPAQTPSPVPSVAETDNKSVEQDIIDKVGTARADMRSVATALEAYNIDWNRYPSNTLVLTTPIAYIATVPADPFAPNSATYGYEQQAAGQGQTWTLRSIGPDGADDSGSTLYDPTNGTVSGGDIVRTK
jgi:hypothetical protein